MPCLRLAPLLLASLLASSCGLGFGPVPSLSTPGALAVRVDCPAGLVASGDGKGCVAPEPASCPKGSAAFFGEATCTPVGARCSAGFVADPSGFGCLDAHAGGACTGATRESPTQPGCVPIGDCAAPFPPAEATVFVDDDFTAVDATHFRSIAAAVNKARTGAVIAVEAGTYAEGIIDALYPVTIVGRCAAQVRVTGTGGNQVALYVTSSGVVARGLTLSGHQGGVFVDVGELTLEDSVVEGNTMVGVFAKDSSTVTVRRSRVSGVKHKPGLELGAGIAVNTGSSLVLEDSAVTDNDHRGMAIDGTGVTVTVKGSYLARSRKVATVSDEADGVVVVNGASFELVGSAVVDSDGIGLSVAGSTATVKDSVIRTVHGRYANNAGLGVWGQSGADLRIAGSTLADAPVLGLYLDGASKALVEDTTVRGPAPGSSVEIGRGVQVVAGAELTLRRSAVVAVFSAGIAFQDGGGRGHLERVLVQDSKEIAWPSASTPYGGYGLLVEKGSAVDAELLTVEGATMTAASAADPGSVLTVRKALLRGTRMSTAAANGRAVLVALGARFDLTGGRLVDNLVVTVSSALGGTGSLTDATITDTRLAAEGNLGYGVTVTSQSSLTLNDVVVARNPGAGLVVEDSQAQMSGGELRQNGVAVHAQVNSFISQSDATTPLSAGELRISTSTQFVDNISRVGVGLLPLPSVK